MATCLYCMDAPADLGRYCSGCYGRVFHEGVVSENGK